VIQEATPDDLIGIAFLVGSDGKERPKMMDALRSMVDSGAGFVLVDTLDLKTKAFAAARILGRNQATHVGWYLVNLGIHPEHTTAGANVHRAALERIREIGVDYAYSHQNWPGQPWVSIGGNGRRPLYQCNLNEITPST